MNSSNIQVGVVGAAGYAGAELLRLLCEHPNAQITHITSRANAGKPVGDVFPSLLNVLDLAFSEPNVDALKSCDLVFFSTPHGVAMNMVQALLDADVKIVDLSADFRLTDADEWAQWYGMEHATPHLLEEAVYGLPELYREDIKKACLVANPGCYPTATLLGMAPLIQSGLIDVSRIISDAKSGVSGAGRGANVATLYGEVGESFKAYGASGHRHAPEIAEIMGRLAGESVDLTFVPHLLPMVRGIEATLYAEALKEITPEQLQQQYEDAYEDEPFVTVLPYASHPATDGVRGTNACRIAVHKPNSGARIIVLSVIDNLIKGAAGQAVQNMNLMMGVPEIAGLNSVAVWP